MTTKEKVIHESIKRVSRRIADIKRIIDARPLLDIMKVREQAHRLLMENEPTSKVLLDGLDKLAKQEKQLLALFKKQRNISGLIEKQIDLESELSDLNNELFLVRLKQNRLTK